MTVPTDVTLDAQGNANAVWVFQIASTLVTSSDAHVLLTNGAQSQNVFWVVGTGTTLGSGSSINGTILSGTAITFDDGATLNGRALAQTAVTLISNTVVDSTNVQAPLPVTSPTVSSAATNVTGTTITLTFNKAMNDPTGKEGQFMYQIGGGADQAFSAVTLNTDTTKIDLTTSTPIAFGDIVTVNYTAGDVTSQDNGMLASFTGQAVINNMPGVISAPTVSSGATNAAGTTITVTFDKAMKDPSSFVSEFTYSAGSATGQTFSAAALNATNTKNITLTTTDAVIASGDIVNVSRHRKRRKLHRWRRTCSLQRPDRI